MDDVRKFCPNCYSIIDDNTDECPCCHTKISRNIENFLIINQKTFTLIGVFGALSVYLNTISQQNEILLNGSFFSICIVILLSLTCIWNLIRFMKIKEPNYRELRISDVILSVKTLPAFILFLVFFVSLISVLSIYVFSNSKMQTSILYTLILILFSLTFIIGYHMYRHLIEVAPDAMIKIFKPNSRNVFIRISILVLLLFIFILALVQTVGNQIFGKLPLGIGNLSFTCIASIVTVTILYYCLKKIREELISSDVSFSTIYNHIIEKHYGKK